MIEQDSLVNRRRWQAIRLSRRIRHRVRIGWRRPLASWRALPRFAILGAQKSGTSSLYAHLAAHPQVMGASWKEVFFFGRNFSKGGAWYRAHFPLAYRLRRRNAITGEATPYYLFHPCAAERMAGVIPDAKLIVLLRNPVDRAISHYWHKVKRGREQRSLEEALAADKERIRDAGKALYGGEERFGYHHFHYAYLGRGLYAAQLERYASYFDRDQLLVIRSEDFYQGVQQTFDRVTDFLDLPRWTLQSLKARNTGTYPETSPATKRKLEAFFQPHNRRLYDYLDTDYEWW